MKTTVNMNHYLTKGIIIMGIALTLQSVISLHKSAFFEMGQGKAISNFSPKGSNANAFMAAMTDNNKKNLATNGSSGNPANAVSFNEPANLEKNLIEAAGLNDYKPVFESLDEGTSSDYLEEMMINAAGLNKFVVAGVDQEEDKNTDAVLEQNMTDAAGLYRAEQVNNDIFFTGDEVDYQALEENMVKAAGLGYSTLPVDTTLADGENDSLETLMINAAGLYQVSPVSE